MKALSSSPSHGVRGEPATGLDLAPLETAGAGCGFHILALDLATQTGWACTSYDVVLSGTVSFKGGRFEGGGMRFLRFRKWLRETLDVLKPSAVFYEEVRRHLSTDAAHVHGGLLAVMQSELEARNIPYLGIPVSTIKKTATGKGNADKAAMVAAAKAKWPEQAISDDNQADALWIMEAAKNL